MGSPGNLGEKAIWPRAHAVLPNLVQKQQTETKCGWQEPVRDRDCSRINRILQGGNVTEDEDNENGEEHGREDSPVLLSRQ